MGGGVAVGNNGGDGAGRWRGLRKSICGGGGISTGDYGPTMTRGGCNVEWIAGGCHEVARWGGIYASLTGKTDPWHYVVHPVHLPALIKLVRPRAAR
jgi:hypothetical protein